MKIVVVSDSHFNDTVLTQIRERHLHEAKLFLHCGDSQLMSNHKSLEGYQVIRGNCDMDITLPNELVYDIDNKYKLFMTHGHLYDVKFSVHRLSYRAEEVGANIVCYGHSHFIASELVNNTLFLNPGSVVLPRNTREKTYIVLTLEEEVKVQFLEVSSGTCILQKHYSL
ncbi:MAG TPA: YfcE family phosphodiesterase [Firmicutes bacterium]|nr:YfcE family phosphodiesterase [Bacillota bacterium]